MRQRIHPSFKLLPANKDSEAASLLGSSGPQGCKPCRIACFSSVGINFCVRLWKGHLMLATNQRTSLKEIAILALLCAVLATISTPGLVSKKAAVTSPVHAESVLHADAR
jgi:hypothetical protein